MLINYVNLMSCVTDSTYCFTFSPIVPNNILHILKTIESNSSYFIWKLIRLREDTLKSFMIFDIMREAVCVAIFWTHFSIPELNISHDIKEEILEISSYIY